MDMNRICRRIAMELTAGEDRPKNYHNFYRCSECGAEWEDWWSCGCNDHCPDCHAEIEPYKTEVKDDKIAHTLAVNFPCDACGEPVEIGEGNETDGRRLCCECFENQATD